MKLISLLFFALTLACTTAPNPNDDLQGMWGKRESNLTTRSVMVDGDQVSLHLGNLKVIEGEIVTAFVRPQTQSVVYEVAIDRPEQHVMPVFGVLEQLSLSPQGKESKDKLVVHLTFSEMIVSEILPRSSR